MAGIKNDAPIIPIAWPRGYSLPLPVRVIDPDGNPYVLQPGEKLRFAVVRVSGGKPLIQKELTSADYKDGVYPLRIMPEDTAQLSLDTYHYDLGWQSADGKDYIQVVGWSEFKLTENGSNLEVGAVG